jgi:GNAT superfamily N-acetyltransferase
MKSFIPLLCTFFSTLCGLPITLELIEKDSERIEETIDAILEIQKSLLLPLELTEWPDIAETGFLTIEMTRTYLQELLHTGKFLIAFYEERPVGYLLLDTIDSYLQWAEGKYFASDWDLQTLREINYIDQIAVVRKYAKHGIGTALVDFAKKLSPQGILSDILSAPYPNQASMHFFAAQKFVELGILQVEKTARYPAHAVAIMLWLP